MTGSSPQHPPATRPLTPPSAHPSQRNSHNNRTASDGASSRWWNGTGRRNPQSLECMEEQADEWASRLQEGTDVLMEKLFAYLSQLPEEEDVDTDTETDVDTEQPPTTSGGGGGGGGMTLPAAAIGWLSSQLYPPTRTILTETPKTLDVEPSPKKGSTRPTEHKDDQNDSDDDQVCPTVWASVTMRDRLRLLRFLLPRVTHLRITRTLWPPPPSSKLNANANANRLPSSSSRRAPTAAGARTARRTQNPSTPRNNHIYVPEELDLNTSMMSVSSGLTWEEPSGSRGRPTRHAFAKYMQSLQTNPCLNLRLFPNLQVLVLESIPPTWIVNLRSLQCKLQVLKWNRAGLYHYLPRLFLQAPQQASVVLNSPARWSSEPPAKEVVELVIGPPNTTVEEPTKTPRNDTLPAIPLPTPLSLTSPRTSSGFGRSFSVDAEYTKLTHVNLNHCSLGELSGVSKVLTKCLPNLRGLSLAHNEFVTQKAALKGLQHAIHLQKLNLSHNQINDLSKAYFYLGGQLQCLVLSCNRLTTTQGLDRLFALQELWVDHNQLANLSEVAGLCRLPQLQRLWIQGNPLQDENPKYRRQLWKWFQEDRRVRLRGELPLIDGYQIATERWKKIQTEILDPSQAISFMSSQVIVSQAIVFPSRYPKLQKKRPSRRPRSLAQNKTRGTSCRSYNYKTRNESTKIPLEALPKVQFTIHDVLASLQDKTVDLKGNKTFEVEGTKHDASNDNGETKEELHADSPTIFGDMLPDGPFSTLSETEIVDSRVQKKDVDQDSVALDSAELTASTTQDDVPTKVPLGEEKVPKMTREESEQRIKQPTTRRKGVTTLQLRLQKSDSTGGRRRLDILHSEWEDVIALAAQGLIPDGKPRMPLPELVDTPAGYGNSNRRLGSEAFAPEATDLLHVPTANPSQSSNTPTSRSLDGQESQVSPVAQGAKADEQSGISSLGVLANKQNTLPDQIYPDDFSVPSSLGTNRDDFPSQLNRFQQAEENATYDGPQQWHDRNVLDNLELYFESYVFPKAVPIPDEEDAMENEEEANGADDWQSISLRYPRIQLLPEDRRWADVSSTHGLSSPTNEDWTDKREKFVRVWSEEVVPCGKPAIRRLFPNRRNRLGFHGDELFKDGLPDPYSEARKVFLCLSSSAFYIILQQDAVTQKQERLFQEQRTVQKKFPHPLAATSSFDQAPWPHAVARHNFKELQAITIGFEFQRLILQFSNPSSRTADPYVYILMTSNKTETVRLLQEIQRLVKEAQPEAIDLASTDDNADLIIENDSQLVLDALQSAIQPEVVGTVLHYQLVQQRWKHGGDRGTVRRACVISDTKVFLLDEDYEADGHKTVDATTPLSRVRNPVAKFANATYSVVDSALLKQVGEVQAAGADPKAITIVIHPLSRLSRTHRWRLLCRDRVGAERLVEDVRKALQLAED